MFLKFQLHVVEFGDTVEGNLAPWSHCNAIDFVDDGERYDFPVSMQVFLNVFPNMFKTQILVFYKFLIELVFAGSMMEQPIGSQSAITFTGSQPTPIICKPDWAACSKDGFVFRWERANFTPLQSRNHCTNQYQSLKE